MDFHSSSFQVFDDYAKLDKVLAAFYEGLGMFGKLDVFKISSFLVPRLFISQMGIASWFVRLLKIQFWRFLSLMVKWVLP